MASIVEPNCDPKLLFYPVDLRDWAEARQYVEDAGDTSSPIVEEQKLALLQYAQEKREAAAKENGKPQ